ncbi:hypothetical protein M8J76_008648 [Diaphorina citri]|nr:hypothetical protein M8J76_008648 [Diaphorina citri]
MSQIKLQSLIFLCPVCNITKYVNIQKYINNILNVNKHKLTCPLCINNYIGINNLIIHIITDHKNLLSVSDGNVSVNLNNFAGNGVITNVESVCGDLKIRERHDIPPVDARKVNTVPERRNSKSKTYTNSNPYIQTITIDELDGHSKGSNCGGSVAETPLIINADSDLVILETIPSESFGTRITTSPVDYTEYMQRQELEKQGLNPEKADPKVAGYSLNLAKDDCHNNAGYFEQKNSAKTDGNLGHDIAPGSEDPTLNTDMKVPDEMFIDNSFCDKYFDYNKFKDHNEIDGLKFDIDQFLNEMSNANLLTNDGHLDSSNPLQNHNQQLHNSSPQVDNQLSRKCETAEVPMHEEHSDATDVKSNFIWNEVNSMNHLFNMNQMNLLQTNVILEESSRDAQPDKLNTFFIANPDENKMVQEAPEMVHDMSQASNSIAQTLQKSPNAFAITETVQKSPNNSPTKPFQLSYENLYETGTKRPKPFEDKPNRLRLFKEKQNKFKTQRLKKLQLLTMNKKFEDHLFLDETRRDVPSLDLSQTPNAYGLAILKNGGDFVSNKRQSESSGDFGGKYARTGDKNVSNASADDGNPNTSADDAKDFKCTACNFLFQNADILAMHNQLLHNPVQRDPDPGEEQDRTLQSDGAEFGNKCSYCPRVFKMKGSLMIHLKVAHMGLPSSTNAVNNSVPVTKPDSNGEAAPSTPKYVCSLCSKSFKKEPHLLQHLKTHEGKQWECKLCSKLFTTKYFLKKHNRLHTGEMPYKCDLCDKSFTFQQSFHKHLLYHSDEKPYVCDQCGRGFKELSTLHNHQRIHSGEKPFCCEICGKSFRQRVSYLVHQRIHTGVTPYKCSACHKMFRYKISDKMHKCTFGSQGRIVKTQNPLIEKLLAKTRGEKLTQLSAPGTTNCDG